MNITFWALVGLGPNDVEITSLIFSTKERALEHLIPALGEPSVGRDGVTLSWKSPDYNEPKDVDMSPFYTHYYNGCGGCGVFVLQEVEEGKPFCSFDLD